MKTLHSNPSKILTLEEFLQLEETNTPCELINGELIMSPSPTFEHQTILGRLYVLFFHAAEATGGTACLSPFDLHIDEHNVFQPDLMYLSPEKKSFIKARSVKGPPDIALEILSPSNSRTDKVTKKNTYLEFGVNEYWIVDPFQKNITVYTQSSGKNLPSHIFTGKDSVGSPNLPTLTFNLDKVFSDLAGFDPDLVKTS
jgi:Uma2 family endonuclease